MCLGNYPYDQQRSVFWNEEKNLVRFKYPLPSGTKQEDVTVGIDADEDGNLLTITSKVKVVSSHNHPLPSPSSSMTVSVSYLFSFLKKKKGDTTSPIISMKFNLPTGLDHPAGFKTAMDDAGVLTVTFTKLKPEKKKLVSVVAKKMVGCLAQAVLAACLLTCDG